MKVGDYVRTDKGKIGKIVHFEPRDKYPYSYDRVILDTEGHKRTTRNIIRCSEDIIDLIEVGDYINGEKVIDVIGCLLVFDGGQDGNWYIENEEDIKSILTKEQFKSMEYKIGD